MEDNIESKRMTEHRAWHKPELRHLTVNLDTGNPLKGGSAADGPTFDHFVGAAND